jgi:hypothetical protein
MRNALVLLPLLGLACSDGSGAAQGGTGGASSGGGGESVSSSTASSSSSSSSGGSASGGSGGAGGTGGDPWEPVVHLKEVDAGTVFLTGFVEFDIPDRTLGFTALATAPSPDEVVGVADLTNPSGAAVISGFAMAGHTTSVFGDFGWIAAGEPQSDSSDAMPVAPGTWRMTVGTDGSATQAHVSVFVRRTEDGQFHGGVMDVNVFIAPGVADSGYMSQVLDGMFPFAGIDLGDVAFFTLPSSAEVVDDDAEYRSLLMQTTGATSAPALNLLVVGDFSNGDFGGAIGRAGGVPGSAVVHETAMSGVVYQPSGDVGYDATVLMHEVGHLGGLFHTTEFQIVETDSLSDTPACDASVIQSNPDACPDTSNMMFPIAYGATSITASQLKVLQGSALYRGVLTAGGAPGGPLPVPVTDAPPPPLDPSLAAPIFVGVTTKGAPLATLRPELRRLLTGVWCPRGGDYLDLVVAAAGRGAEAAERLRRAALDRSLPDIARARALRAAFHAAPRPEGALLDAATALAREPAAGRLLRIAALRSLERRAPARARRAALGIEATGADPVIVRVAGGMR